MMMQVCRPATNTLCHVPTRHTIRSGLGVAPRSAGVAVTKWTIYAEPPSQEAPEEEGLDPEDDFEIPGTYRDAMSSNTQLGKAIKDACGELDTLAALERETLTEAEGLLKKLGFKGSLFEVAPDDENASE